MPDVQIGCRPVPKSQYRPKTVDAPVQPKRIVVLERVGQQRIWQILITNRTEKAVDRQATDLGRAPIRGRWVRAAVHHCVADFNARAENVDQQTAGAALERGQDMSHVVVVSFVDVQCGCHLYPEHLMIVEPRIYHCLPGRLPALNERFQNVTLALWLGHGIEQIGFFTTVIGPTNQSLTYPRKPR